MKRKIFTFVNPIKWGRGTSGTYTFLRLVPNAIWETYGAPHILHLEYSLVSRFRLTLPTY